ncbi:MAG: GNAT family N-acetyltransferase [Aliishimia sp.]
MTDFDIEPTTVADLVALQRVLKETDLFPSEALPDLLAASLSSETSAFWLTCHQDGTAVGFCYAAPEEMADAVWNMRALAVLPACQGKGLGTALVRACEARLKQASQRLLLVDTSGTAAFARTRSFYVQNGYVEAARIVGFWAAGDDKVTLRKDLL